MKKGTLNWRDLVLGIVMVIIGLYLVLSPNIVQGMTVLYTEIGFAKPRTYICMLGYILLILSIMLITRAVGVWGKNEDKEKEDKKENKRKFHCLVLAGFASLICYIPALKAAGFTIPTCILMSLFSFIIRMREKNVDKSDRKAVLKCAGIAVVYGVILTLVMEFAFTKWLNVRLP